MEVNGGSTSSSNIMVGAGKHTLDRPSSGSSLHQTHSQMLSRESRSSRKSPRSTFGNSAALESVFNHSLKNSEPLFHTAPIATSSKGFSTTTTFNGSQKLGGRYESAVEITMLKCSTTATLSQSASTGAMVLLGNPKVHAEPTESVRLPRSGAGGRGNGKGRNRGKPGKRIDFSTTFMTFPTELFLPSVTVRWDESMQNAASSTLKSTASGDTLPGSKQARSNLKKELHKLQTDLQEDSVSTKLPRSPSRGRERSPGSKAATFSPTSSTSLGSASPSRRERMASHLAMRRSLTSPVGKPRSPSKEEKIKKKPKPKKNKVALPAQRPAGARQAKVPKAPERNRRNSLTGLESVDAPKVDGILSMFKQSGDGHKKKSRKVEGKFGGRREINLDEDNELLRKVFKTFQTEGDMSKDHAVLALRSLGYVEIDKAVVDGIIQEVSRSSFLDYSEFCDLIGKFSEGYAEMLKAAFEAADTDGNGAISSSELVEFMHKDGTIMIPGIVREIIAEITGEPEGDELTNVDQYLQFRNIIRLRGGFTAKETDIHHELFVRYDQNADDKINFEELTTALMWRFPTIRVEPELSGKNGSTTLEQLMEGVELLNPGEVSEPEFLQVMRKCREGELARVTNIFYKEDNMGNGYVDGLQLVNIMQTMGYKEATIDVIQECAEDCGLDTSSGVTYYFDDVMLIVLAYREHEGYMWSEIEEFHVVYDLYDDGSGGIGEIELGGMLRWLGFPTSIEQRQDLMAEVDVDNSGVLDFDEFLKVTRRFREEELEALEKAFTTGADEHGRLTHEQLERTAKQLGYPEPTDEEAMALSIEFGKETADFIDSIRYIRIYRSMIREAFNKNSGFTNQDVEELRAQFEEYDTTGKGFIQGSDMAQLLQDCFPEATADPEQRKAMLEVITLVDDNGDGKFEYAEFLKLMRIVKDRDDHRKVLQEQQAAMETGYSHGEVRDFRMIYKMVNTDKDGGLDYQELKQVLEAMLPAEMIGPQFGQQLADIFSEVDVDGSNTLDFAEFLGMMRKVQDLGARS